MLILDRDSANTELFHIALKASLEQFACLPKFIPPLLPTILQSVH